MWRPLPPLAALAVLLPAAAASAQLAPPAPIGRVAPPAPVVDRVRALFPQTDHWFEIVDGARFEPAPGGALRPDFASLTHARVRPEDAAGHHLVPTFAATWRGAFRLESSEGAGRFLEVLPVEGADVAARIEDGLVVYAGAYPDTDVLFKATPTHVDEYRLLLSRDAPSRWLYRVRRGPGIARLRQAGAAVEAVDDGGVPWFRASAPFAVDARGVRADGTVRVVGEFLEVDIDVSALEPPILVDPDWRSTGDMAYGRFYHGSNILPDGRILSTGGCSASVCSGDLTIPACRAVVTAAEALDLGTRTWSRLGDAAVARFFHVAESLDDGSVLTAGGCTDPACAFPTERAEIFDAAAGAFRALPSLPEALAGAVSTRLRDGRVLVAGGCTDATCSARAHLFDPTSERFTEVGPMHVARGRGIAALLSDGRVLVAGGCTSILCAGVLADAEIFDPRTGAWTAVPPLGVPRAGHYASTLHDGRVLVGGGCSAQTCGTTVHTSAEIFDPVAVAWTPTPAMARPRFGALAVRLTDGSVMVSQGCAADTDCDLTNEVFDVGTGAFRSIENAVTVRAFHTLLLHPSAGLVVAIGGCQPRTCSWWNETYDISALVPLPDAGVLDAGPPPPDAGPTDAGEPVGMDAARADAGPDAGPAPPPREGGCTCRAVARAAPPLGLVVFFLLFVARRR